jgi:O-antigen ligase
LFFKEASASFFFRLEEIGLHIINKDNWQILLFYIAALLFYPLVWERLFVGRLAFWSELNLLNSGLLTLLCLSLLLFYSKLFINFLSYKKSRIPVFAFLIIFFVSIVQLVICYGWHIDYLWSSLYWIMIPVFCAVNYREIEKLFPYFMIFLFIASIIQSLVDISIGYFIYGISGNWNWNASLLAVTLPFVCWGIHRLFYRRKIIIFSLITIVTLVGLMLIFACQSKAALLSLFISSCFLLILYFWPKFSLWTWGKIVLVLFIIVLVLFYLLRNQFFLFIEEDQRFSLWAGVLNLISQKPLWGCGPELFESAYAPFVPASYYLGRLVDIRHTHAHNHLLHFAATMGIPALIAWLVAICFVLYKSFQSAVIKGDWRLKLCLFVFVLLLVHSMFDIIVLSWPLGCIFLITFGILIGRITEKSKYEEIKINKYILDIGYAIAICCAVLLLNGLSLNFLGSMYYRNSRIARDKNEIKLTFDEARKSITYKKTPWNTLLAARISLYDFKNPKACLKFLDMLESTGFENYEHNNLLRAKALVASGKPQDSLFYFAKEQENFPLSCVNLYYYELVLRKLGRKDRADFIGRRLKELLDLKGLDERMLPVLLKDPSKDMRFRELKNKVN